MPNLPPHPEADPKFAYFYAVPQANKVPERKLGPNGEMQGIFTTSVLEAFRGHKTNSNGHVTMQTAKEYLHAAMLGRLGNGVSARVHGDDIVIAEGLSPKKTKVTVRLKSGSATPIEVKDGSTLAVLDTITPAAGEFSLELEFGTYFMSEVGSQEIKPFTAYGERCDIEF